VSRKCSSAATQWVWGMLVYSDVTSIVTKMVSCGRGSEIKCREEVVGVLD